jgi:hypothetical protein
METDWMHKQSPADVEAIVRSMAAGAAFDPCDIQAMATALNDVCHALNIRGNATAREVIAIRIVELARRGERSPTNLRDRLLAEANGGTGC